MSEAPGAGPGLEERRLEMGRYFVSVATGFGPRIVEFGMDGAPPLFARLSDDVVLEHPAGTYRFRGGHRLWAAPEIPAVSYAPDDRACRLDGGPDQARVTGPIDQAGLVKTIDLQATNGRLVVDHTLSMPEDRGLEAAAWAITQLKLGGVALLPIHSSAPDDPRASASIVLWPYTDLTDARLGWEGRGVTVRAEPGRPFKIGVGPNPGKIGYLADGYLFVKEIAAGSVTDQPDRGAVAEVYVNEAFVELESLGPLVPVGGERTARHREVWTLQACHDLNRAWEVLLGAVQG